MSIQTRVLYCCGCGFDVVVRLTHGGEIYPHRPDLKALPFWICDACGNFVGCHHKTANRTRPLGCIPTLQMKAVRKQIHAVIDPLWQSGKINRRHLYARLGEVVGGEYHTGELRDLDVARRVLEAAKQLAEGVR